MPGGPDFSPSGIAREFSRRRGPHVAYLRSLRLEYARLVLLGRLRERGTGRWLLLLARDFECRDNAWVACRLLREFPDLVAFVDYRGWSAVHHAAHGGYLRQLPRSVLTAATLAVRSAQGHTPIHVAALAGHLRQIPTDLLAPGLGVPSFTGSTPLHLAGAAGCLRQIPLRLLTEDLMSMRDREGMNVVQAMVRMRGASLVPRRFRHLANAE